MILQNITLKTLQVLFYFFPITFIFGNFMTNVFILLISIIGIIYYKTKLIERNEKLLTILFLIFFFIILITSYTNHFFSKENPDVLKSILYLRYFLFLIIIKTLVLKRDVNINKFFIFSFLIVFFVSLDILIQFIFGKNILGFEPQNIDIFSIYYTGLFKEELIAGGFIMMFSTLSFFSIPLLFQNQSKINLLIIFIFISSVILTALFLAGNRMPTILFIFFLILSAILYKNKRKKIYVIFTTLVSLMFIILIAIKFENIKKRYMGFYAGLPNPVVILKEVKKKYPELKKYKNTGTPFYAIEEYGIKKKLSEKLPLEYEILPFHTGHRIIYITSIDLFLEKPLIGRGIKSFRNNCKEKIHLPNRVCESHPHNFFLDLLNDIGLIGLIIFFIPVVRLFFSNYFDYLSNNKGKQFSDWVYLSICLAILIQFFPFKSSGSFFSTYNSAFTFLILGISLGIHQAKIGINQQRDY